MPPGVEQSSFPRMFAKLGLLGEASVFMCLCAFLSTVLTAVEAESHRGMNDNQDVPSECLHARICDSKRGGGGSVSEDKVIFALKILGPIFPVHVHSFHKRNI